MPRYNLVFDKNTLPKPGTYFCTKCNAKQIIRFKGQEMQSCSKCGGQDFKTV